MGQYNYEKKALSFLSFFVFTKLLVALKEDFDLKKIFFENFHFVLYFLIKKCSIKSSECFALCTTGLFPLKSKKVMTFYEYCS